MPKKEILKKNLINITEGSVSYKRALKRAKKALEDLDAIATGQTIRGKKGEDVVIDKEHDKKILSALRHIEDVQNKITDGSIEQAIDKKKKKEEEEVTNKNEKSEAYGKMPEEVIPENVVSLSEKSLKNVIRRVIQERTIKEQEDKEDSASPVSIFVYWAQQLSKLAEKHSGGKIKFDEDGIGNLPEFKEIFNKIKGVINTIK